MNIRDLKYLVALAEYGHFGKAAETCFVSQPALSMQIKKLEEDLGVSLLERTNKSVVLTDVGELIAAQAQQILLQIDEIYETAKNSQNPYQGELKIGVFPTLAPYLLPIIIPKITKKYPKISFYLLEEQTANLIDKLKQGHLHAALLATPVNDLNLKSATLFKEEFLLAVANSHPLSNRKTLKPQDLTDKNLLLLDEGHCLRSQALSFCEQIRASEMPNFRATSLETLRHMIATGIGMTLMPKLACTPHSQISYIPFSGSKPSRTINLFWRKSGTKHVLLSEIAAHIQKIMVNLV